MKNMLVTASEFLARAQNATQSALPVASRDIEPKLQVFAASDRPAAIAYARDKNTAFVSAVFRPHEFADHDCVVLALVGPKGGTRGLGTLNLEQARDLQAQLAEAIRQLERR